MWSAYLLVAFADDRMVGEYCPNVLGEFVPNHHACKREGDGQITLSRTTHKVRHPTRLSNEKQPPLLGAVSVE